MKVCPQCQMEYPGSVDYCPSDGMKLRARRDRDEEDPLLGRALDGRWIVEEKIGEGGMGAVYRAHQRSVDRTVAIKTLRGALVDTDEFVDRFFREAQLAGRINSPHCVTIFDYGQADDGTLFLAMEFLEGTLLTDRMSQQDLTIEEILRIGVQITSALAAAHEHHVVHRDLKPDNIFLTDVAGGGTFVKVLDFGIAKALDSNTQVTKTGMIFGTPEYMSPEQCKGGQIDGRSDLYSLGCILFELVGGRTPFKAATPMAVLLAHVNQAPPPLHGSMGSAVPDGVEAVILKLLAKTPGERYRSAAEARAALEAELSALDGSPSASSAEFAAAHAASARQLATSHTVGMGTTANSAPTLPSRLDGGHGSSAKNAWIAAAVAALLVFVAAVAVVVWVAGDDESAAGETASADEAAARPAEVATPPEQVAPEPVATADDEKAPVEAPEPTAEAPPVEEVAEAPNALLAEKQAEEKGSEEKGSEEKAVEEKATEAPKAAVEEPVVKRRTPTATTKKPRPAKKVERKTEKKAAPRKRETKRDYDDALDSLMRD